MQEIEELKRQGLSIQAISPAAGIRSQDDPKVLAETPAYGPRPARPSKLDAFKPY